MKKILLSFFFLPLFLFLVTPVFASSFSDSFTGTNGTTLHAHNALWNCDVDNSIVTVQDNTSVAGSGIQNCLANTLLNGSVSVDVTTTGVSSAISDAVILRYQSPGNYYQCNLNTNDGFVIFKFVNGSENVLVNNPGSTSPGTHTILCNITGSNITLSVDGSVKATATDSTFSTSGLAGFQANTNVASADNYSSIDNTPGILFSDTFTGQNGTDLNAYNANYLQAAGSYTLTGDGKIFGDDSNNNDTYFSNFNSQGNQCLSMDVDLENSVKWYSLWLRNNQNPSQFNDYRLFVSLATSANTISDFPIYIQRNDTPISFDNIATHANTNATAGMHTLKFCAVGTTLTGYLDGAQVVTTTDTSFQTGTFGFSTRNGYLSNLVFDDASNNSSTPAIVANASTKNVTVGTPFNVDVKIQGSNGDPFNAAGATVSVSSNLSITGLHSTGSTPCNLQYTKNPTTSDPSFAGAIFGGSSSGCTAYTLTLTPTSSGTGTISFTNGSIKSYATNAEILTGVTNGSFTINDPTPTPTPQGQTISSIDDSVQGTGVNQWNYVGSNWGHCTSCNDTATFYNSSISWDKTTDEYVTLNFTGTQVALYGFTDPRDGIGAVSIDGGTETTVDFYSATRTGNVLLWTSPTLSNSSHTLKVRVTGTHSANASDVYLGPDRATVTSSTGNNSITFNTYPLDTYAATYNLTGGKDASLTSIFVNGSSSNSTYPTSTTWQNTLSLALGNNTFLIYGKDDQNNQTATQSIQINRHTLADINGDGVVDLTDASLFAVDYGKTSNLTYALSDMNNDGTADLTDLSILAKLEQ